MAVRWSGQQRTASGGDWPYPSGEQWTISAAGHRAVVVQTGGGLRTYECDGEALVAGYDDSELAPQGSGQLFAPWPDRLAQGQYTFASETYRLPLDEPELGNAVHGLVRWLPWECAQRHDDSVTLTCLLAPRPGYPWPLRLSVAWKVSADGLRAVHTATNLGSAACPFGLGAHPYVQVVGVALRSLLLQLPVTWRLLTDDRQRPRSRAQIAGTSYDFRSPTPIGEQALDASFAGVRHGADGAARSRLTTPDGSRGVEVWQDSTFSWLRVYSGVGQDGRALAIAPMTCPPNAFNSRESLILLQPGHSWSGTWGIRPYV
ncbi:MAG: aldose 1-epimerase family protein [Mycobacteriales bacterium]